MKIKLLEKRVEAKGTKSFFWEPEKKIDWLPGQYFYYTLPELKFPDKRGATRHFTISSSPTEGSILRLTTRIRDESGYKKTLDTLALGTVMEGEGPSGTFIIDEKEKGPHIFLAGGIGITPFRTAIKYINDNKISTKVYLIYSNSIPEEIAYRAELESFAKENQNIVIELTVSKPEESKQKWTGKKGRIDKQMLTDMLHKWKLDKNKMTWWCSGPPVMIDSMEEILEEMSVSDENIRSEKFTGY